MNPLLQRIRRNQRRLVIRELLIVLLLGAVVGLASTQLGELYLWLTGFYR